MDDSQAFDVDVAVLRDFAGRLTTLAEEAEDLAGELRAITAATGRVDSDQMGALAPGDVAAALSQLGTAFNADNSKILTAATGYAESEGRAAGTFGKIRQAI